MMLISPDGARFLIPFMVVPALIAGIAMRGLGTTPRGAAVIASVLLAFLGALSVGAPIEPYARYIRVDPPYSPLAKSLAENLRQGDTWAAYPYFLADRLYRFAPLPTPVQPQSEQELLTYLETRKPGNACFVLVPITDAQTFPELRTGKVIFTTPDDMVLLRMPPR